MSHTSKYYRALPLATIAVLAFSLLALSSTQALAAPFKSYDLAPDSDTIGQVVYSHAMMDDTLLDIARDYDLGYNEIVSANPDVDPWVPQDGQRVVIPTAWVLPDAPRTGIVINIMEMRLFYYFTEKGKRKVATFPIGVGTEGNDTPVGVFRIVSKEKNPVWYPPDSVRKEKPELPKVVPPGPNNPLGAYKFNLNIPGYRMHGTNRPWGVGRRVSHGCIRLYPEDVAKLYKKVDIGERVEVVYQAVKVGVSGGRIIVEVHDNFLGGGDPFRYVLDRVVKMGLAQKLDAEALNKAIEEKRGLPTDVTIDDAQSM